tara:strand:- start:64 stop:195 length:132 start_codon:yes stop_codon:yes gene_type:complete
MMRNTDNSKKMALQTFEDQKTDSLVNLLMITILRGYPKGQIAK